MSTDTSNQQLTSSSSRWLRKMLRSWILPNKQDYTPKVCNLRPILLIRLCFGFYADDVGYSNAVKYVLKMYCTAIPLVILGFKLFCIETRYFDYIYLVHSPEVFLYLAYYVISLHTEDKYLLKYFNVIYIADKLCNSKSHFKQLRNAFIFYAIFHIMFQFCVFLNVFRLDRACGSWMFLVNVFYKLYMDLGRLPIWMVFSLSYIRVRTFRAEVTFEKTAKEQIQRNKSLLMYKSICDSFDRIYYPTMFLFIANVVVYFLSQVIPLISFIVKANRQVIKVSQNVLIGSYIILLCKYVVTFFPAVVQEFILEELEQTRHYIADQLVSCTDVRHREEMRELLEYMRGRPLQYSVSRVLRVDAGLPLGALSLAVNYLVLVLQFTSTPIQAKIPTFAYNLTNV